MVIWDYKKNNKLEEGYMSSRPVCKVDLLSKDLKGECECYKCFRKEHSSQRK